jgi:hypothetical protein
MLPLGDELFTSMNPFAAKIWIGGRAVCQASTCDERTTIVPSRVLPEPVKRRSTCAPGADGVRGIDDAAGGEVFTSVDVVVAAPVARVPVLALADVVVPVAEAAPVFARALPLPPLPAATIAGPLWVVAAAPVLVVELEPPPQPTSPIATSGKAAAASDSPRGAAKVGL